jgi:RNA polymerase sigma-70 factor (ECF subfamily)
MESAAFWGVIVSPSRTCQELFRICRVCTFGADVKDDSQLIDEALEGDTAAFGQLVQKHQDRLYNTLVHVVGCRVEAEDVVQDAFVQAFLKLRSFQRNSAFYTWLYRIAFNAAVSRRRRKRVEFSVEQGREQTGTEPLDDGEAPSERLERQERARQVRTALATLTEEHRAILVLREMEGCCYETIADVLKLPVGTVRSRLHRARLQLREQLKEEFEEHSAES